LKLLPLIANASTVVLHEEDNLFNVHNIQGGLHCSIGHDMVIKMMQLEAKKRMEIQR